MKGNPEEEGRRWLIQAQDEFADAKDLRERERFYPALLHFRQAAERALKAHPCWRLEEIDAFRARSVAELLEAAEGVDGDFSRVKRAKALDAYHIPTGYPNGLPGGAPSRFHDGPPGSGGRHASGRRGDPVGGREIPAVRLGRARKRRLGGRTRRIPTAARIKDMRAYPSPASQRACPCSRPCRRARLPRTRLLRPRAPVLVHARVCGRSA